MYIIISQQVHYMDILNLNLEDRDRYYYKRVYLGCVRANDFLVSLPQFDGTNLAVTGGSQGGALSITTAALDARVKYLAAFYPALCDLTGYLKGRAGGWPHLFDKNNISFNNKKEKLETAQFYDVVNFARLIKVPGMYSWGFNDETCPPTSMYAAYNVIQASKSLYLALETGHWTYPEQTEKLNSWLLDRLQKQVSRSYLFRQLTHYRSFSNTTTSAGGIFRISIKAGSFGLTRPFTCTLAFAGCDPV